MMLNREHIFFDPSSPKKRCIKFMISFANVWRGHDLRQIDPGTLDALRKRAWAGQVLISLMQIAQISAKEGSWFGDPVLCNGEEITDDCIGEYNKEMLAPLQRTTWYIMRLTVIIGALCCFACCKWP